MSFLDNIKNELQKHNKLTVLLVINISIFFIINISVSVFSTDIIVRNLALPLNLNEFVFKFWTLFTYMFSHKDFGHVFYNMLLLYFTARTFLNFMSEKKLMFVYMMSGLMGGLILIILSALSLVSDDKPLIGASAAVIGIVSCLAIYIPNLPVSLFGIIEMKYKYCALLIFAVSTIIDFDVNTGGKISHFGGAFFGLLFGYLLKNGKDISELSFFKRQKKTKLKVVHNNKNKSVNDSSNANQKTIDELLDKISKNGYENLSKTEKELLFKLSQKK